MRRLAMIPKIIHFIWLGDKEKMNESEKIKKCVASWHEHMPDYQFMLWTEENFDIDYNDFTRQAYDKGQYAFVSDVIRLYALYTYGGIYMDTDVFCYKPLDEFLTDPAFTGFEDINYPVTATMGAEPYNPIIKLMLDYYDCIDFKTYDVWTDYIKYQETNTCIMSNILGMLGIDRKKNEKQTIKNFVVYPQSYFFTQGEGWTWHSFTGSWRTMITTTDYCMKRHCKTCKRNEECRLLNATLHKRLMQKPFENLEEILKTKNGDISRQHNLH